MLSRFLIFSSVFVLAACAYVVDGPTQKITFLTPGANNAICYAFVDGVKHRIRPPQTVILGKSVGDLEIDCLAPGNRRKKVFYKAQLEDSFTGNLATAGSGVVWDALTESMFAYPDTIEIDFRQTPIKPEAMPAQNHEDIRQPEEYDLEEFRPGLPRLNDDRYNVPVELEKKMRGGSEQQDIRVFDDSLMGPEDASYNDPKSDLAPVLETYGGAIDLNPSGDFDVPAPLYPGE